MCLGLAQGLISMYALHESKRQKMIKRSVNDKDLWKNDYPIILVHGYCGSTMDENWILGGYFHYAFSATARYLGLDPK